MVKEKAKMIETLQHPDLVQRGDFGTLIAVKFYEETPLTSKYLTVIYRELDHEDGFILTAYFTTKPSERREVVWRS